MSRCILVVGTGRCGTSAVARVLHEGLGVHMGGDLFGAGETNKFGHYEDLAFDEVLKLYRDGRHANDRLNALIRERQRHAIWGVKHPNLVFAAMDMISLLTDVKVICCSRDRNRCIRSFEKAYSWSSDVASQHYQKRKDAEARLLRHLAGHITIDFDELLDRPSRQIDRIVNLVTADHDVPHCTPNLSQLIDPSLRTVT